MALPVPVIVGVFERESQASRALTALKQARFSYDQVGVAAQSRGTDNLFHDFLNLGIPQEYAFFYDQQLKRGRTVISVRPDGRDQEVRDILYSNGAYDYDQRVVSAQDQRMAATQTTTDDVERTNIEDEYHQPRSLRLHEERLEVRKRNVQTGEVQLHKEVVTEQKTMQVPITHEEVTIEHRLMREGKIDATPIGEEETIRIPVLEERVYVAKTPIITGEVKVGKRVIQETHHVSETIRHEEPRIEQQGEVHFQGTSNERLQSERVNEEGA